MDEETRTAFAELRTYLETRFSDLRGENLAMHQETRRHTGVLIERVEDKIAALVEGFTFMNEKVDRTKAECDEKTETLDTRVTRLAAATARPRRR